MMKDFFHNKKSDSAIPEETDTAAQTAAADTGKAAEDGTELSAKDVETENLKNAIAQVMAEETAVLPHIEQLSSSVAKESGLDENSQEAASQDEEGTAKGSGEEEDAPSKKKSGFRRDRSGKTPELPDGQAKISAWFVTFMTLKIPIVCWIYLLYLSFSKNTVNRRNFARAYLLVKLIFFVLGLIILLIIISMAMNILEDLLEYMAML